MSYSKDFRFSILEIDTPGMISSALKVIMDLVHKMMRIFWETLRHFRRRLDALSTPLCHLN